MRRPESVAAQYLEQFRALADSWYIISRFDRDLRLIYVNGATERITGVCANDLVGRTMQDIRIDTPQIRAPHLALRQVFRTGTQRMLELEAPTVLGPRSFQTYMAPEFDPDGTVRSIVVAARDITQQQRTEQERVGGYNGVPPGWSPAPVPSYAHMRHTGNRSKRSSFRVS